MAWFWLILAGIMEIGWAIGVKYTEGFSKLIPSALTISAMIASLYLVSLALREIPMGTAYAIWTGIGAVGVAVMGILFFGESRDLLRVICILLIVVGMVGLKFATKMA